MSHTTQQHQDQDTLHSSYCELAPDVNMTSPSTNGAPGGIKVFDRLFALVGGAAELAE
jgi:hypothetical protein